MGRAGSRPPRCPRPHSPCAAFETATNALYVRVIVVVALALLSTHVIRGRDAIDMMLLVTTGVTVLATITFTWGVLAVDRARLGVPRIRLVIGVAMVLWAAAVDVFSGSQTDVPEFLRGDYQSWTIAGPVVAIAGILFVLSAIHRFAATAEPAHPELQNLIVGRGVLYLVAAVIAVGLPHLAVHSDSVQLALVLVGIAALASIVGLIAIATVMALAARSLADAPQLPEARARS